MSNSEFPLDFEFSKETETAVFDDTDPSGKTKIEPSSQPAVAAEPLADVSSAMLVPEDYAIPPED